MDFIKARLREASTWRGLILLATIAGVKLSPDQVEAIVTLGVTLIGTIGVFFPDKKAQAVPVVADKVEPLQDVMGK